MTLYCERGMKETRNPFSRTFWMANTVEVFERFTFIGIFLTLGIYTEHLEFSKAQLGVVQSSFLLISYITPIISGTFADKFGFKKMIIISCLAYLPSTLLLIVTETYSGIALTMLNFGLAAGIFKPLIAGTIRAVTDNTNKTFGFGIFYVAQNIGATFGPIVFGNLRAISWKYAFFAAAISVVFMLLSTIFVYKEPPRELEAQTLKQNFKEIINLFRNIRLTIFLILAGVLIWLPFWSVFNVLALYIEKNLDTVKLYLDLKCVLGTTLANYFSHVDGGGTRRLLGETIANTAFFVMFFQLFVSKAVERLRATPAFLFGMLIQASGCLVIGIARISIPTWVFLGIFLFAVGEMITIPRLQEFIIWLAPKERAGLFMGANCLCVGIGAGLSGVIYTTLYGHFRNQDHPEYIWYTFCIHLVIGILILFLFARLAGELKEEKE